MRKIFARLAVVLVAVVAGAFAIQSPAAAATWGCPTGTGCVYTEYNGQGSRLVLAVGTYGVNVCHNFSSPFRSNVSSVEWSYGMYGSYHLNIKFYDGFSCSGGGWMMASSPTNIPGAYNNAAVSFRIQTY